jgi:hypothetical protein
MNTSILKSRCAQICAGVTSLSAVLSLVAVNPVRAVTFNVVGASWTQGSNSASLTGTVDIPIGTYTFAPGQLFGAPAPFTGFDLNLNINGRNSTPIFSSIRTGATSSVTLTATAADLQFSTSGASDSSVAYLLFNDFTSSYFIGSDAIPGSQFASGYGDAVFASRSLPTVFAVSSDAQSVPEPTTIPGLLLTGGSLLLLRRCYRKSQTQKV